MAAKQSGLAAQMPHDGLAVILVNRQTITEMNETFLQHQGATDVITFDYRDDTEFPVEPDDPDDASAAGEIFICLEVAEEAAHIHRTTFSREVVLYCVHGMLHLAGLDDHEPADRRQMRAAERRIMTALEAQFSLTDLFTLKGTGTGPSGGQLSV